MTAKTSSSRALAICASCTTRVQEAMLAASRVLPCCGLGKPGEVKARAGVHAGVSSRLFRSFLPSKSSWPTHLSHCAGSELSLGKLASLLAITVKNKATVLLREKGRERGVKTGQFLNLREPAKRTGISASLVQS